MGNRKQPEVRFEGFMEDWEEKKLKELAVRITRKNKELESDLPLTISAQDGLIDQNKFFNKIVASRDVSGYYLIKNGEFAYNKSYSNGYPWGAVKRLNRYEMGVLSTLYIVFKPNNILSDFLEKYYDTTYWFKEVSKNAAEGARNHGLLNITAVDFFDTKLKVSKNMDEQQKIGTFFKQLDEKIALQERQIELLKEQKKGFLQKMFPKTGEKMPEVRFAGFTEEWEDSSISFLGEVTTGKTPNTKKSEYYDGEYLFVTPIDIQENRYVDITKTKLTKTGHYTGKTIRKGSTLFVCIGSTIGKVGQAKRDVLTNQQINAVTSNYRNDDDFVYISLLKVAKKIRNLASSQAIPIVNKTSFEKTKILITTLDEQKKIGTFFKILDDIIALNEKELVLLKETKKGFLQKMFV